MRKAILFITAAALAAAMSGCGKKAPTASSVVGDGKDKPAATEQAPSGTKPAETAAAAAENKVSGENNAQPHEVSATQPPFVESNETTNVTTQEIPVSEKKEDFEKNKEPDEFVKYVSGDNRWGVYLPKEAVPGDEDESGIIFMLKQNPIAVNTMDKPVEFRSADEAKAYFSALTEVKLNSFKVIYDNGVYAGCSFDFETLTGLFGFGKYAVKGNNAASAMAMNYTSDAAYNDVLRDAVNSLVVFE